MGRRFIIFCGIAFLFIIPIRSASAQARSWAPERTWVFMVGLLEWKDAATFESFPKENRRDRELLDVLKKRGVPPAHVVYLQDRAATTSRIKSEFQKFLLLPALGDTIFVYYEGHGYKRDETRTYLVSYDVDDDRNPGWSVASIPDAIEKYFKGSDAIIALDNCYAGTMANVVKRGKRRVSYAVLASSSASQASTGNWTFTEAVISAFRGDAVTDDDHDGIITFAELEANAEADMLFGEEQIASFAFTGSFDPNTVIGTAAINHGPRVGERVEAYSDDDWYRGYIEDAKNGKFLIHYYGYEVSDDEWVSARSIRVPKVSSIFKVGESVQVQYKRKWYPAHVLDIKGGSHYVSYDDYDIEDNEWVSSRRIRKVK